MFPHRIPGGLPGPSSRGSGPTTPVDGAAPSPPPPGAVPGGSGPPGGGSSAPGGNGPPGGSKPQVRVQVRPFTKESLDKLESKTVQLVRDYGFQPRRKLSVEDGSVLPNKFEPFPSRLYGRPLEEIDNFIYDETFCVVSKRFRKNYIHRFTATNSFFLFSPWNSIRRTCIFLSTNQYFDYVVMTTILLNCVFLAKTEPLEEAEFVFLAIYTAEMIIKSVAKGFILNKYTYLRNPWNWLDFVVITSGYATIGMEVGNLAGLRTFRVLRALKTVSIMPGLKTIINALLHSFKQLAEVMTLTIFCLMVFALFALQVYMGELRNKCVMIANHTETHAEWREWISNSSHWIFTDEDEPMLCGNMTGARHCPPGFVCLRVGENPNHGYTSFDNFLWSMLTTFQLITLDYWENVYNMVLASCGPLSVVFFTVVVFFGSFYLINLMLAVVALSYEEEAEITQEERRKDLTDHRDDSTFSFDPSRIPVKQLDKKNRRKIDARKGVLLSSYTRKKTRRRKRRGAVSGEGNGSRSVSPSPRHSYVEPPLASPPPPPPPVPPPLPPANPDTLHPLGRVNRGQLSSRQASSNNSDGNNRESSLDDSGVVDDHEEGDGTSEDVANIHPLLQRLDAVRTQREKEIKVMKCNGVSPLQGAQNPVYTLPPDYLSQVVVLDDLVDRNCEKCTECCVDYEGWLRFQNCLYKVVRDPLFELLITLCIVLNTMFLATEHHGMSESILNMLDIGNKVFTSIFTLECTLKLMALSKEFFDCGWNIFDLIIVSASLLDLSFELVDGLSVLRGLRLLRVLKLAQSWTTMKVLLSIIISTIGALGNLTFVLVIVIYIFAVIGMQLFSKDYTPDKFDPDPVPRWNFSDFFHSFMMIFRILCGEWIEPLWDCMRAEKDEGPGTCFAIFLPALVMGNFMVLNLFLALLLNSFNSEELKSKKERRAIDLAAAKEEAELEEMKALWSHHMQLASHVCRRCSTKLPPSNSPASPQPPQPTSTHVQIEEVGEDSKIARSFERIRSIIRKKKRRREIKEKTENEKNLRLEELVSQVVAHKKNKKVQETVITTPPMPSRFLEDSQYSRNICDAMTGTVDQLSSQRKPLQQLCLGGHVNAGYYEMVSPPKSPRLFVEEVKTPSPSAESIDRSCFQTIIPLKGDNDETSINMEGEGGSDSPSQKEDDNEDDDDDDSEKRFSKITGLGGDEEDLYTQIMREAMKIAPTMNRLNFDLPTVEAPSPVPPCPPCHPPAFVRKRSLSTPVHPLHRRSYQLATRQDSSEEEEGKSKAVSTDPNAGGGGSSQTPHPAAPTPTPKKPWLTLVSYVDELTVGGRRDSQGRYIDGLGNFPGFGNNKPVKIPQDCFPQHCYQRSPCCDDCMQSCCGKWWLGLRKSILSVVDTPAFEWFILVLIFSSSITLCFEDIYLDENLFLKNILYWTNFGFCAVFSVEMLLKWIALGFYKYFTSFWTILDFIIVFVSVFSLLIEENENLKVLRSLRTLRALRPLRAISRWQGMRIVVNALMYAIPSIFNVLLVCLVFWLIFSIMGVQFFGGKFFKCVDEDEEVLPIDIVNNRMECLSKNYTWINSKITFDNVGIAYLALFQVATFEGWMEVMADAVDARGVDLQPQYEANLYAYVYFVIFIVCGSFFTLNLFIGVIIDNFNMLKKKYEGGVLEMFLTESQKHYYTAMKKLGRKKPQKVIKRPINQFLAMFYDLSNSRRFEIAIFVLIFLNMLTMGIEHYNQHHAIFFVLEVSNAFFTTVFGLEALVKIVGLRYHYFTVPWNLFDFILVLASILGILMEDIMIDFPVSPTLLRVVRVFRIGRILRLIKAAKGIRKLLFALVVSLPALFNIGALLGLITFIYAIIGMSVFGHVKQQRALNDMVNFETFGRSMQLLFRLMTSAGWNDVLESLMIQPPDCDPTYRDQPNGNCGNPVIAITYFTSFIIISYMIVINMYIAIILENFNQAHQEEEIGIVEDDLEMFYIRWSKFDPHATQFIRFAQLSDFIASLDPPLGIAKPNIVALVSFNLPIARGNKIHCLDILHSLVKHVLGHVEETDEFKKLQDQMDVKFKKQFPTRKELEIVSSTRIWKRQDKAARLIQRTYRDYKKKRREALVAQNEEDENTQTSSPGGWQGKLSAFLHVHRGSRASSRKSSRASDASDLSEMGTSMWLNLPLLLLTGTQANDEEPDDTPARNDVCITVSEPSPEQPTAAPLAAPRHCSLDLPCAEGGPGGVAITVTEPSPDEPRIECHSPPVPVSAPTSGSAPAPASAPARRAAFRSTASEATIVHHAALVHRESEEYEADCESR